MDEKVIQLDGTLLERMTNEADPSKIKLLAEADKALKDGESRRQQDLNDMEKHRQIMEKEDLKLENEAAKIENDFKFRKEQNEIDRDKFKLDEKIRNEQVKIDQEKLNIEKTKVTNDLEVRKNQLNIENSKVLIERERLEVERERMRNQFELEKEKLQNDLQIRLEQAKIDRERLEAEVNKFEEELRFKYQGLKKEQLDLIIQIIKDLAVTGISISILSKLIVGVIKLELEGGFPSNILTKEVFSGVAKKSIGWFLKNLFGK